VWGVDSGDDLPERAALITGLIFERPLCLDCLSSKATLRTAVVEHMLARIATVMVVARGHTRCRGCGETKDAVSLKRPATTERGLPKAIRS